MSVFLERIALRNVPEELASRFPFLVPAMQLKGPVQLRKAVTLVVGENGSGKSTFLEALACCCRSPTIGAEPVATDPTLADVRRYAKFLRLSWKKKTFRGFFLRAEDFFGFAKRIQSMKLELNQQIEQTEREFEGKPATALRLAQGPLRGELRALEERYGPLGLDAQSHGESFLELFRSRFVPGGLYLLDEPEAPLSPTRQLALIAMLKEMATEDAQFVIATHSPILMAFPDAEILSFDGGKIQRTKFDDVEHVTLTRDFLRDPESFLRHL